MNTTSAFASIRRHRLNEQIDKGVERVISQFYSSPETKQRAVTKVARRLLIQHDLLLIGGKSFTTHSKSIGAGVHEIYLKKGT